MHSLTASFIQFQNSLVVQWLKLGTSNAGACVWCLVGELRSHMLCRVANSFSFFLKKKSIFIQLHILGNMMVSTKRPGTSPSHPQRKPVFFFFFFYFAILYWFCHTLTWIHHRCTWVPNPESPPTTLPISSLWVIPVHQTQAPCILYWT